jgi:hypothetical protein
MGGLIVATALTLFFLPVLYVTWFRIRAPQFEAPHAPAPAPAELPEQTELAFA